MLLVWGKSRVVPVMLTSFSVTEEAFDPTLNPIEAKVDARAPRADLRGVPQGATRGRDAFKAYHSTKEKLAAKYAHGFDEQPVED